MNTSIKRTFGLACVAGAVLFLVGGCHHNEHRRFGRGRQRLHHAPPRRRAARRPADRHRVVAPERGRKGARAAVVSGQQRGRGDVVHVVKKKGRVKKTHIIAPAKHSRGKKAPPRRVEHRPADRHRVVEPERGRRGARGAVVSGRQRGRGDVVHVVKKKDKVKKTYIIAPAKRSKDNKARKRR